MSYRFPRPSRAARPIHLTLEALDERILLDAALPYSSSRILVRFDAAAMSFALPGSSLGRELPLVDGLYQVDLQPGTTVEQALASYRADPRVAYAQPDYQYALAAKPNDPSFAAQWGLHNTGQNGGTKDADVDAPEAWNVATGSGRTIVAIVDSGVDWKHPDLAANVWVNAGEIPGNGIDDDGNGYVDDVRGWDFANNDNNPMDDNGHGTHVAGIIGAVGNNGIGVAGVLWRVQLMPLKFLDANGMGYNSDAIRALGYAVANGAQLSNHSWGGTGYDRALHDAIEAARRAGHVIVTAAGNSGANNDSRSFYPANYPVDNVVTVAASDRNDRLASWSNFGVNSVDLAAPGVNVLSTIPKNGYASYSGTSMAAPFVTGVLALVRDQHPEWTYRQVINQVLNNVDPLPSLAGRVRTGGRLNAAAALGTASKDVTGPRVLDAVADAADPSAIGNVRITFSEPIDPKTFTLDDVSGFLGPKGAVVATGVTVVAGSGNRQFDVTFPTQTFAGSYRFLIGPDVRDLVGNQLDQDGDGVKGEAEDDRYLATFTVAHATTFSSSTPLTILDRKKNVSVINVEQSFKIKDLNVRIDVTHPYLSDLYVRLRSPRGQEIVLSNRRGGSGDDFRNTVFDDQAPETLKMSAAPFEGHFKPDKPLAVVNGTNAKGKWQLLIEDKAFGDDGFLKSWSLLFEPATATVKHARTETATRLSQAGVVDQLFQSVAVAALVKPKKRGLMLGWVD